MHASRATGVGSPGLTRATGVGCRTSSSQAGLTWASRCRPRLSWAGLKWAGRGWRGAAGLPWAGVAQAGFPWTSLAWARIAWAGIACFCAVVWPCLVPAFVA